MANLAATMLTIANGLRETQVRLLRDFPSSHVWRSLLTFTPFGLGTSDLGADIATTTRAA